MARDKALQANIDDTNPADFPNKRLRDNDGSGNGTSVNEIVYGDIHEYFAKLMRLYAITYNGLPDNETNGYQLIEAVRALATKNDYILDLATAAGKLTIPVKLAQVIEGESFVCLAQVNKAGETQLTGTLDVAPVSKAITYKGGDFKTGEYIRVVVTPGGVDLIRLSDGEAFEIIANESGYLKAATQLEEDTGAINTVATTPLTNFTAFALRVIGADSVNYLATLAQNGLLSKEDKAVIDGMANPERNYGTFGPLDVGTVIIGQSYPVSGDITQAQVTQLTPNGNIITVTVANAMDNPNYQVSTDVQGLGVDIGFDNNIFPPVFKVINTTQFQIVLEESIAQAQSITIHVGVIQR